MLLSLLTLAGAICLLMFLMGSSAYIISHIISLSSGAPYVSTRSDELKELIAHIPLQSGSSMIELGCGDGRVIRAFAQKYAIHGVGYDVSPLVIGKAKLCARLEKLPLSFHMRDIRTIDFTHADSLYLFLFPTIIQQLEKKLTSAIQKGTLIISHGFAIPYLKPYLSETLPGTRFKTYLYRS